MENILQSLVKIIIIGALYEKAHVDCNRQFLPPLPPPLPYYQNDDYYLPGFAPAFHNQLPTYYPDRNLPNPTSFQNVKSYASPQLFYQNENYIPPPFSTPGLNYPPSQLLAYKQSIQPHKPQQKVSFAFSRVQYKNPPQTQPAKPQQHSQKKTEAFASNIIVKEEPLYTDDYGKNYSEDDYTDSYLDDSPPPPPPKPCSANDPYRYFEAPKGGPNNDKSTLCSPYFQPNFGSGVYTLKVPITLLPSRFPPRVEQLIERIQNYFSTYTQQQTVKPQNETVLAASSTPTAVEVSTEAAGQSSTADVIPESNNRPAEIQQETTASAEERITDSTTVATAETKDSQMASTPVPEPQGKDGPQMETQTTPRAEQTTEQMQQTGGTVAEPNLVEPNAFQKQPVEEMTPVGGESPHNLVPEEQQPADNSSSTTANQNMGVTETNGSFQANDSSNG